MDQIAAAAASCPEALIEISIRQPDAGPVEAAARAQTLVRYLAAAGIAPDRLVTDERRALAVQSPADSVASTAGGVRLIVR
ncbi:hypothetical protein ACFSKM_12605 [Ancylobacter dichloromethanicus]